MFVFLLLMILLMIIDLYFFEILILIFILKYAFLYLFAILIKPFITCPINDWQDQYLNVYSICYSNLHTILSNLYSLFLINQVLNLKI